MPARLRDKLPAALAQRVNRRTLRNPGADLTRLPVGFDLRSISIAEGVRAALACAAVILLYEWVRWPPLLYMALAANLACFSDAGGPLRPRLLALSIFSVLGGLIWAGFGLLRPLGLPVVVPLACLLIFCTSFARVWGVAAMAAGNVLTVVLVLALDQPLGFDQAVLVAAMFVAGGAWAALLALVTWWLDPYRLVRIAVADVWRLLAALSEDIRALAQRPEVSVAEWEAHGRAHRRPVRQAIEDARTVVMAQIRRRGSLSPRGAQALLRLETGEQVFGILIALSDVLEAAGEPGRRGQAAPLLRRLPPLLLVLARAMAADASKPPPRLAQAIDRLAARGGPDPILQRLTQALADRLRVALKLFRPGDALAADLLPDALRPAPHSAGGQPQDPEPGVPWRQRLLGPIVANLTWRSATLRHALRAASIAAPALVITLLWQGPFNHWLTITVVLTMQPFYSATWQRALERIGGTVLGGLIGALLAYAAQSPLALAALMFPLCIIGFSARGVSYGFFIACLMPQLVVLVELIQPGHSSWEIVEMRALFTVLGGMIAVAGCLLLWPSWEPPRLRRELQAALRAHARFAEAVLSLMLGEAGEKAVQAARRSAGVAANNLEASLSRAMQEPRRRQRDWLEAAMVVDATLRRIGGRLAVLQHEAWSREALDPDAWRSWRSWIGGTLDAFAAGEPAPPPRPEGASLESLSRIARQIELLQPPLTRLAHPDAAAA
ncbi:MAG: FUSC family protein [Rhodospirillales bacterium]